MNDDTDFGDSENNCELGACLTAISYWEMSIGDSPTAPESAATIAARRLVIRTLNKGAGLDHFRLVRQARDMRSKILNDMGNEGFALFNLPKVDAKVELDHPLVDKQFIPELEDLIVGSCHFFALNAAYLLYSMRKEPEYPDVVKRVLTRGRGESLRSSAALANELPSEIGQQLILDRLCNGESTSGCYHLYLSLTTPYGPRHLEAVRKGLRGPSARAAKGAAELIKEFPMDSSWAAELRTFFDEWRTKEEPYPERGGAVPESPRDELVKTLTSAYSKDHDFLLALLEDKRPAVQNAASEQVLVEAAGSVQLCLWLLEGVQTDKLKPRFLRAAVTKGLFYGEDAIGVVNLLHSDDAQLRYAALPILNVKYLPPDQVRVEAHRLISDRELDIREGASQALNALKSLDL